MTKEIKETQAQIEETKTEVEGMIEDLQERLNAAEEDDDTEIVVSVGDLQTLLFYIADLKEGRMK